MTSENETKVAVTLSVTLPVELHTRAREAAVGRHMSLASLVRQALEEHLAGGASRRVSLDGVDDTVKRIEQALDRVLVETIRLGDRIEGMGR